MAGALTLTASAQTYGYDGPNYIGLNNPNYGYNGPNYLQPPADAGAPSNWAIVREAQAKTAADVPNSGMAVTIDIGEADNIHPINKQDVGLRLALAALAGALSERSPWTAFGLHTSTVRSP